MDYTTYENSISTEDDMEGENGFSSSMLIFAAVMTFIIMIVGIFGNLLTVVALIKCPKVKNVAAAFIISLCIADLIFCALVLPFSALRFIQGTWTHGEFLCKLIPFIQYGNIGVSLLCIAMITINRYVMIAHHSSYVRIYKKHWIAFMIAFCWLFSYGMQLPTLLGVWGKFDYDPRLATCSIMSDEHGHSSKTSLFITAFVIPCLVIIACYTKIFWVVHNSEMRMKRHANKQNSIPNNLRPKPVTASTDDGQHRISSNIGSESSFSTDAKHETLAQKPSRIKDQREVRAKRNEWRITKMVLAIFLSFVICYLPITIAKVADKNVEHPGFHIFSYIMLYLSACINPIIYVIMNKQYRKAYKTVIMCEPTKLLAFAKTGGASSAAEMERYRVEPQPQPHNGFTNVSDRAAKYQLEQFPASANCIGRNADSNIAHGKPNCRSDDECSQAHDYARAHYDCAVATAAQLQQSERAARAYTASIDGLYKQVGGARANDVNSCVHVLPHAAAAAEQRPQSHNFRGGRYYSGGGGGNGFDGLLCNSSRAEPPRDTNDSNDQRRESASSEEKPILWPKYKRHSR